MSPFDFLIMANFCHYFWKNWATFRQFIWTHWLSLKIKYATLLGPLDLVKKYQIFAKKLKSAFLDLQICFNEILFVTIANDWWLSIYLKCFIFTDEAGQSHSTIDISRLPRGKHDLYSRNTVLPSQFPLQTCTKLLWRQCDQFLKSLCFYRVIYSLPSSNPDIIA